MKTVDPGQILICRQRSTSRVLFGHVNTFAFACAVLFKPDARYTRKYVCTIFSPRVDFNPPLVENSEVLEKNPCLCAWKRWLETQSRIVLNFGSCHTLFFATFLFRETPVWIYEIKQPTS